MPITQLLILIIFNNYFSFVGNTTEENIKYSHKHFSDYLNNQCNNSVFIQPTDSEEITNVIFTLDLNKCHSSNSIPYKILKLLKKYISKQLPDLFSPSLSAGVFPSLLKKAKVVLVYRK